MIEELQSASQQLEAAIERYLRICSSVQGGFLLSTTGLRDLPLNCAKLLDREVNLADSYNAKLHKARNAIRVTLNSIAPINCLPSEILIRILHMARDAEPSHIDSLAVVCSRWRAIALDSHSLWSHISFRPYHSRRLDPKLLTLPRLYTSRSGGTPLDVCIFAVSETYSDNSQNNEMKDLCGSIAPRIRSLELDFKRFALNWGDSATNSLISRVFSCCRPGILTKLVTTGYGSFSFFATADGGNPAVALSSWEMVVGQKRSNLEALLAPITILHLAGVFPYWASLAYRGLVELSLHANFSQGGSIPEPDLIRILESSPGLRILHIEIHITNQVEDISASRVNLPDLELLHLGSKQDLNTNYSQIGIIRLLTTGVKPLYLSIQNDNLGRFSDASKAQIEGFLERSAVTRFRANNILHPFEFLASVFPLEVLVLSECQDLRLPTLPDPHSTSPVAYPQVQVCIVLECSISLSKLRWFIERFQIQTLEIFRSKFYRDGSTADIDIALVEKELSTMCPNVKITDVHPLLAKYQDLRIATESVSG